MAASNESKFIQELLQLLQKYFYVFEMINSSLIMLILLIKMKHYSIVTRNNIV